MTKLTGSVIDKATDEQIEARVQVIDLYVKTGADGPEKRAAAQWFDDSIERSLEWVGAKGKFYNDDQRREVVDLFRQGQQVYRDMIK